ncbi:hypothetical protein AS156_36130 [Bradyrhizobium macuxiense]|uniref:Uncharacterized protein n=1 Tax=Bradyrhizobium macuxiense TaxID=1755647 RepID=A0A109JZW9_9BRAD|nr:hypothetical protein AS156_36130 [Bradyrhizobium macuxiense]
MIRGANDRPRQDLFFDPLACSMPRQSLESRTLRQFQAFTRGLDLPGAGHASEGADRRREETDWSSPCISSRRSITGKAGRKGVVPADLQMLFGRIAKWSQGLEIKTRFTGFIKRVFHLRFPSPGEGGAPPK